MFKCGNKCIILFILVHFTCYEDYIILKKGEFHAFCQAHFNTNIVLTGTNSDCGGLHGVVVVLVVVGLSVSNTTPG